MSAIVNARDLLLQGAPYRGANPENAAIILTPSAGGFKVDVLGDNSPEVITFTATLVGLDGIVSFVPSGGVPTYSGNVASLDYDDMGSDTFVITASITSFGVTYTSNQVVITKLRDGVPGNDGAPGSSYYTWVKYGTSAAGAGLTDNPAGMSYIGIAPNKATATESTNAADYTWSLIQGANGSPGARGPGHYQATGSVWSDATAEAATPGASVADDIVTISNGSGFAESRRYTGSAWAAVSQIFSGALLVSQALDATKFASSIEPVGIVSAVPSVKTTNTVFNTANGKLYRWNGTAYVASVPTVDLVGTITNAQIADLAAAKLTGQITTTQITDDAISTPKLAAGAVVAAKIAAGAVTTEKLLVTSKGNCINPDPLLEDVANAWGFTGSGISVLQGTTVTGASGINYFSNSTGGSDANAITAQRFAIDPAMTYNLTANLFVSGANNRKMFVWIDFYDASGNWISTAWGGSRSGYLYAGLPTVNIWSRYGGQFGADTVRAIPAAARTCYIGVWFQYSLEGSGGVQQAAQDIRLERVIGATLIADGAVTTTKLIANAVTAGKIAANAVTAGTLAADAVTAGKIAAGAVSAREIAAGAITAGKILVGTFDNILPDPAFADLTWWGRPGGAVNDYTSSPGFWKNNKALYIDSLPARGAYMDTYTEFFPATPGATYRVEYQCFVSGDFVGTVGVYLHIPGQSWFNMGGPTRGYNFGTSLPVQFDSGSPKGAQEFSAVATFAAGGARSRAQLRITSQCTAGYIEFGSFTITRVSDSVLIADGAVTASKVTVANLQALSANIGLLRTAASGARTEIADNVVKVYDASNVLRVKIGNLDL